MCTFVCTDVRSGVPFPSDGWVGMFTMVPSMHVVGVLPRPGSIPFPIGSWYTGDDVSLGLVRLISMVPLPD